jgi:ketosteroid isomerase-like protein
MHTITAFICLCVATFATSHADELRVHGPTQAAQAIVKADTDFAALAKREGTAKAFRDSMDAVDGVIYGGGSVPAVGSDAIYKKMGGDAPDDNTLEWQPQEVFAAKGGDMGVSRGRWTATSKGADAKVISGSYVTVWRKNAKGEWKGLVDIGNADKPH